MNVVYPYIKNYSRELEWSIESLKNFEHDGVYVIGDKPDYDIKATIVHPKTERWGALSPYANVINKLLIACNLDISDDFLFMNDDIFLLAEYDGTTFDRGDLLHHINNRRPDSYTTALRNTFQWLEKNKYPTKNYETHTPMVFNKTKLKELIERIVPKMSGGHTLLVRSLYGNVYDIPSEYMAIDTKDPPDYERRKILSTNEATFNGKLGEYIRESLKGAI